jgi:ABC-type glycerol-3-phosphate transport system substrate-binding protein
LDLFSQGVNKAINEELTPEDAMRQAQQEADQILIE